MLKKSVTYVDFNGEEKTDILYFNLNEPEIFRLEVQFEGGLRNYVENITEESKFEDIMNLFEKIIMASYGEKSSDGRHFDKSPEMAARFSNSAAYAKLFMDLVESNESASDFFNALITFGGKGVTLPAKSD